MPDPNGTGPPHSQGPWVGRPSSGDRLGSIENRLRSSGLSRALLRPAFRAYRYILGHAAIRGIPITVNGIDRFRFHPDCLGLGLEDYEHDAYRTFVERLGPGDHFIDVGAHVGVYTLAAARRVGPDGRVLALEPVPPSLERLRAHVRWNGMDDVVETIAAAASDVDGVATLHFHGGGSTAAFLPQAVHTADPSALRVTTLTLDGLSRERRVRPRVVKIDVEGAELHVLRGMGRILDADRPSVFCEVHPVWLGAMGGSLVDLEDLLRRHGYSVHDAADGSSTALGPRGQYVFEPVEAAFLKEPT